MKPIDFQAKLREMMAHAGLSQQQLSDKLEEMGYPVGGRTMIGHWVRRDGCRIRADRLLPIAEACGLKWKHWIEEING